MNGLVWDVLVKEKDAVESLILGAGSGVVVTSQAGEEEFDLLAAGKSRGHVRNGIDISPEPIDVCGFSGPGFVLESEDLAQILDGLFNVHGRRMTGWVGQIRSNLGKSFGFNMRLAVVYLREVLLIIKRLQQPDCRDG